MGNVNIINHPLVKHKITLMRDEKTGTREFRILVVIGVFTSTSSVGRSLIAS